MKFNERFQVYMMFLQDKPVLQMIHLATQFCPATFLKSHSEKESWSVIQSVWSFLYVCPPRDFTVDQASSYLSLEMRASLVVDGIALREEAIGNPRVTGTVARYHAPLPEAYLQLRAELDQETTERHCLQFQVLSVNMEIRPEGLFPVLLVFGVIPLPARHPPSQTQW